MKMTIPVWAASLLLASVLAVPAQNCSHSLNVPSGYSMIANHCDNGGNTVGVLMPSVPVGSRLVKFNKMTQKLENAATFTSTGWVPATATLHPGEGAFFCNPGAPFTLNFNGTAHTPVLPVTIPPATWCILSAQQPVQGNYGNIVGAPPADDTTVFRYDPVTGSYISYLYDGAAGAWTPSDPTANVGESVWVCTPGAGTLPGFPDPEPPCIEEFCIDFNDGGFHGFHGLLPCQNSSPGVMLTINNPGPSGAATDLYLRARDLSGPSLIQNFTNFNGDWRCIAANGCAELCFDIRIFIDGLTGGTLALTPSFVLLSDPDGPCGPQPPIRAQFRASFTVTEDGGTNDGWHRVCAPLSIPGNNTVPSNSNGGWTMLSPHTAADWPMLLANVTGIQFPIDFTSNPAEEVGYDNICLTETNCPKCFVISDETIECLSTNGTYTYTFSLTNYFNGPLDYLVFADTPGVVVLPSPVIHLPTTLTNGQGTTLTVTLQATNSLPPSNVCFFISVHEEHFMECCAETHCITLPTCCALITNECVVCDTNGNYIFTFDYQNLSTMPIKYIYLVPENGGFSIPPIVLPTPLAPGGTIHLTVPITPLGTNCVEELCMIVSAHDVNFEECCATRICIDLPPCCKPRTYTLDADFDLGTTVNLNHDPNHHQLQLNTITKPLPYIAVACSTRGTAVRIDVNTGVVLGEYLTSPDGMGRSPSRTTVDKFGNVWVGNRNESGISGGQPKGSVVRIGLIIGGTRGDKIAGMFVPNPLGLYIQNPTYSTCTDRDGDGLIKTSRGLGDILSWNNAASADTHGGVSTAEDECIQIYTRVTGSGTRFVSIDCNNDVWTGGLNDRDFEKLDGTTGLPVPGFQFNIGCGGYGGLVDGNGVLWSAPGPGMRFVPNNAFPPGAGACLPPRWYGTGISPLNCHIYVSSGWDPTTSGSGVMELDPATGNVLNSYPGVNGGQGICVDANGHIWVAQGSVVAHLAPLGLGHFFVGNVTGFQWATGVAVDSNGRIWATDFTANEAVAIDPAAGPLGVGSVPIGQKMAALTVNLGAGANPYNYSDMTGFVVLGATCRSGFWDIIHEACAAGTPWGVVSWNALVPTNTSLTVEVRAADAKPDLATKPFKVVKNGVSFCDMGINGKYLEVRVNFTGQSCSTNGPVLYDLTVDCCPTGSDCTPVNHLPVVECPDPVVICADAGAPATATISINVTDADGDALQVSWREGNNPPFEIDSFPAGGPPSGGTASFTHTYTPGMHVIIIAINDGSGFRDVCDVKVTAGDTQPPDLKCPPGVTVTAFQGSVPSFLGGVTVSDNCTPAAAIQLTQTPPAGTGVGQGSHQVAIVATDGAGNSSTCYTFYAVSAKPNIISPANYAHFDAPAMITLTAEVPAQVAGQVREVRFRQGGMVVAVASNAPYRATVTIDMPGFYPFRAEAVSQTGIVATSDQIQLFVDDPAGGPSPFVIIPPLISNFSRNEDEVSFWIITTPGATSHVEYTDSLSPIDWKPLQSILGDGQPANVRDLIESNAQRFYRIRVQ